MTGSKVARFLIGALLIVIMIGLATTWGLSLFGQEPQRGLASSLLQTLVQPLGTAVLAALYYWNEYLKPKSDSLVSLATSDSVARSAAVSSASPQFNFNLVQNAIPLPNPVNIEELAANVIRKIAENRNVTAASVVAEEFVLVDGGGKRRALLGLSDAGAAGLWIFDVEGRQRLWIGVGNAQEPILSLISRSGATRLGLVDSESITGLTIKSDDGKSILNVLGHADDGHHLSSVMLCDPRNKAQVAIYQGPLNLGVIFGKDKDGKAVWAYPPLRRTG